MSRSSLATDYGEEQSMQGSAFAEAWSGRDLVCSRAWEIGAPQRNKHKRKTILIININYIFIPSHHNLLPTPPLQLFLRGLTLYLENPLWYVWLHHFGGRNWNYLGSSLIVQHLKGWIVKEWPRGRSWEPVMLHAILEKAVSADRKSLQKIRLKGGEKLECLLPNSLPPAGSPAAAASPL